MNMLLRTPQGDSFHHHLIHQHGSVLKLLHLAGRPIHINCGHGFSRWYYSDHDWHWVVTIRKGKVDAIDRLGL